MDFPRLSKQISYALRHAPWEYELELDDEGWVYLTQLLDALNSDPSAPKATRASVEQMIRLADKQRHEIVGDRIRALYGHSVPGKLKRKRGTPPDTLYHGTSVELIRLIRARGLLPMSRQYVHLSTDEETARRVGSRKRGQVAILRVHAHSAAAAGVPFYEGNSQVWLADEVPARWIEFP
jgi:putative RNA 2'-phosphotransferase